jgi:hypothetical protein
LLFDTANLPTNGFNITRRMGILARLPPREHINS